MRPWLAASLVALLAAATSPTFAQCAGGASTQTGLGSVSCAGVAPWSADRSYPAGTQITHNGCRYTVNRPITPGTSAPGTLGVYAYGNGSSCPTSGCYYGADGLCRSAQTRPDASRNASRSKNVTYVRLTRGDVPGGSAR